MSFKVTPPLRQNKKAPDFTSGTFSFYLCGGWDLNPHVLPDTRSLVLPVCQFQHLRATHLRYRIYVHLSTINFRNPKLFQKNFPVSREIFNLHQPQSSIIASAYTFVAITILSRSKNSSAPCMRVSTPGRIAPKATPFLMS